MQYDFYDAKRNAMITGIQDIIGKTITQVIVSDEQCTLSQVFLLFSDNTYYELYTNDQHIEGASRVYPIADLHLNQSIPMFSR